MKTIITFCAVAILTTFNALAQGIAVSDSTKTNPIIYADANFGFGFAGLGGLSYGTSLNYQFKKNLITARINGVTSFKTEVATVTPFVALPYFTDKESIAEYALLYGYRTVNEGRSLSFSAGISQNYRSFKDRDENDIRYRVTSNYIGLPFEFNVLWFKSTKKRYRIYYIIPVGKPTGFGGSVGFKLSGNISKRSYAALGLTFGLGYHKHY